MKKNLPIRKIIYFDRETIQNILQETNKGSKTETSDSSFEGEAFINAGIAGENEIKIDIPLLARIRFVFSAKLDAKYIRRDKSITSITSTEISEFESIQDKFKEFTGVKVFDIENSSTFFRVAGGYLQMAGQNVEGMNTKDFLSVMQSFEGYDVYKIDDITYVRFNTTAFVSNYKRNELLSTLMTMYCIPVGKFSASDFDFMKQLDKMQRLISTTNSPKTIAEIYPPKVNDEEESVLKSEDIVSKTVNSVTLYDVVYSCIAETGEM